jgi:hypothetical protein
MNNMVMRLTLHFFIYNIVLMKLKKLFPILFLLLAIGVTTPMVAQVKGGRKKEHRNQRSGGGKLFGGKSKGNANSFAKGASKKGFLARIFKSNKSGSAWVYHKTDPGKKQKKEQFQLFSRNRTKGKRFTDGIIAQQNRRRSATRVTGNSSFSRKKR